MNRVLLFAISFIAISLTAVACKSGDGRHADLTKHILIKGLSSDGTILQIDDRDVSDKDLTQLSLPIFRNVKALILRDTNVGNGALPSLSGLPLEILDLGGTRVSDEGLKSLSKLPLKRLILKGTNVSDQGIFHLKGTPLEWVILSNTKITDAGLVYLQSLPLRALNISDTSVTDAGLESLKGLQLERLDLNGTKLNGPGLAYVAAIPTLKQLSVVGSTVDSEVLVELKKARPDLSIIQEEAKASTESDT